MNSYEGMYIFPASLNDEGLDNAVKGVREDIEKLGGTIENFARMGKRSFSREMKKQSEGHYVVFTFSLDGDKIDDLQSRNKLSDNVFRAQLVKAPKIVSPESEEEA